MSALSLRGVRPWHGPDGLSMEVEVGERALIRGPRGTLERLFRLLSGRAQPEEGEIEILGAPHPGDDIWSRRWAQRVSLSRGELHLVENVDLLRNLTIPMVYALGISESRAQELAGAALEKLGLNDIADRRPAAVPRHMRQLTHLARATTPARDLTILLEPQRGLPPDEALALTGKIVSDCRTAVILCSEHWLDVPDGFRERSLGKAL